MYFGETQIFENRINDFASVAKDLELKEISEGQDETEDDDNQGKLEESAIHDKDTLLTENNEETNVNAETNVISDRSSVTKHRQKVVSSTDGRFSCDECEATFINFGHLTRHKQSKHEGEVIKTIGRYSSE